MKKKLIDILKEKNIANAESLIRTSKVIVNGEIITTPGFIVNELQSKIEVKNNEKEWVSRGAFKLIEAIKKFNLDFTDKIVLDIGSSTGGFTEVSLKYGAKKVFALDSGTNQLDYKLRINPKVEVYEKTNLKNINFSLFNEYIDIVVCDVSFISLKEVFKVINFVIHDDSKLMLLIKPQFEASRKYVKEGGFVEEKYHDFLINRVKEYGIEHGFKMTKIDRSPILGNKSKNIEYISLFEKVKND
ncbi:TlyA family RNA methyltransferase [Mesomycoplasma molare]|uniref:TlyA family RNA methyltransferase n=1 Tax=Mesomycoplasma molare TaxID=171288 RepID=A0ABY5TTA9_9BACT|nr:TlyA family RNA methyltransferase [Mesomycoplasma molare]UWD33902.1 TlyA family RNA methyltransferase [Mesomycoplasma molare]